MRIVTLQAIAHRRRVHRSLQRCRIFFRVTADAQGLRSRCDQLDSRDVFTYSNFVTAQTSGGDRRVDGLPFRFVLVALDALSRIDVLVERNRMLFRECRHRGDSGDQHKYKNVGESLPQAGFPNAQDAKWGKWEHRRPLHVHDPRLRGVNNLGRYAWDVNYCNKSASNSCPQHEYFLQAKLTIPEMGDLPHPHR
jgi:hypothetical protein